jgi:aquaporin Z
MARERVHRELWLLELVGTAILVFGGLSAVCFVLARGSPLHDAVPSHSLRLLLTGVLFSACNSLIAISPIGRLSGSHLNPAVTLAFHALGRMSRRDVIGYVAAQVVGALGGAAALRVAWGPVADSVDGGATVPGVALPTAFALEAVMTAVLIGVILFCVSRVELTRWTPLAIWPVIALLVLVGAPYTGTSLNPARSLGPSLVFAEGVGVLWLYLLAPVAGGLAVALLLRRRHPSAQPQTVKLFQDMRPRAVTVAGGPRL